MTTAYLPYPLTPPHLHKLNLMRTSLIGHSIYGNTLLPGTPFHQFLFLGLTASVFLR